MLIYNCCNIADNGSVPNWDSRKIGGKDATMAYNNVVKLNSNIAIEDEDISIFDLTDAQLVSLRKQITLNSLFYRDYRNTFGVDTHEVCDFFDGYVDYLFEIATEDGFPTDDALAVFKEYDNAENLLAWRLCYDC